MNETDVLRMISQLRQSNGLDQITRPTARPQAVDTPDFADLFKQAVAAVNEAQKKSDGLKKAFEMGDPQVTLPEVMVAGQKAKVSFEAMVEVRNKLLEAYREVMQMQV